MAWRLNSFFFVCLNEWNDIARWTKLLRFGKYFYYAMLILQNYFVIMRLNGMQLFYFYFYSSERLKPPIWGTCTEDVHLFEADKLWWLQIILYMDMTTGALWLSIASSDFCGNFFVIFLLSGCSQMTFGRFFPEFLKPHQTNHHVLLVSLEPDVVIWEHYTSP